MKKQNQLGMNPSTASGRLVKDILWKFITESSRDKCCKCGELMERNTFSIEHIIPWLDSEDPLYLYFDLENIAFSHLTCNIKDTRRTRKYETSEEAYQVALKKSREYRKSMYDPLKRSSRYETEGR